jgi:hypothetical protein
MSQRRRRTILLAILGAALAPVLAWSVLAVTRTTPPGAYAAPGLPPLTPEAARAEMFLLLPALLTVVYEAFGQTEEAAIYDTLAQAAHGAALESLYLERAGALQGGGLTEADQTIHEMRVLGITTSQRGETFALDAHWQVIGTVGHSEHIHVRGNAYRADLALAPVAGAWKIVDFALREVDRTSAGEQYVVDAP